MPDVCFHLGSIGLRANFYTRALTPRGEYDSKAIVDKLPRRPFEPMEQICKHVFNPRALEAHIRSASQTHIGTAYRAYDHSLDRS